MNATISDLRPTIKAKSDQLNADQLLGGPMTIKVTSVNLSGSDDQPLIIHYEGEEGRPYKPSKTMRKLLIFGWGQDGTLWTGRAMTLFLNPEIKFGGEKVGGIQISHMSDIPKGFTLSLAATKGKKAMHVMERLVMAAPVRLADVLAQISAATTRPQMAAAKAQAELLTDDEDYQTAGAAYSARGKVLSGKATAQPVTEATDDDQPAHPGGYGTDESPPFD